MKTYEATTRNQMTCDGQRALGISIACSSDHDILKVGAKVEDAITKIEGHLPAGIECQKVFFQPERVSNALNTFLINLIESVAIVVLLLIFFRFKDVNLGWFC